MTVKEVLISLILIWICVILGKLALTIIGIAITGLVIYISFQWYFKEPAKEEPAKEEPTNDTNN